MRLRRVASLPLFLSLSLPLSLVSGSPLSPSRLFSPYRLQDLRLETERTSDKFDRSGPSISAKDAEATKEVEEQVRKAKKLLGRLP